MKIDSKYKMREMAGEHVVVIQGRYGADMTRIISFNPTSLYLWEQLQGIEFEVEDVVRLLCEHYGVEREVALLDAEAWIEQLKTCKLV
uniref:PqqD family protein n=1 Tax=Alistipes sp. TaxID=1872444 RepID=UPI004055E79C